MSPKKINEIREWINTIIALLGLLVIVYGTLTGINELKDININLKDIKADKISTIELEIRSSTSNSSGKIINNGSGICINGC